jgi:hypothetical protein
MTRFYNKKHKIILFKIGDEILISSRHIYIRYISKKLINKFLGPFKVIIYVGKNIYKFKLP